MKKHLQATHEDFLRHIANTIKQSKRVTLAVGKTKKEPAFFYTIGNQEKQKPELLIIGNFKPDQACGMLNILSDRMLETAPFKDGELVDIGGAYPLLIYRAAECVKEKYTIQAGEFYDNQDYEVMQVVLPDLKGVYPPDPKCHKDFQVPVFRESKDGIPARGT